MDRKAWLLAGAALGTAMMAGTAAAQQAGGAPDGLEEIVITARGSRLPENIASFPGSVSMIDTKTIEGLRKTGADLGAMLGYAVPGMSIGTQGNSSNFDQTLRGRNPAILIDGVPIGTPLRDGRRDARAISPAAIERIEVIRGASALYGNGGAGGVINYITRTGISDEPELRTEVGTSFSATHFGDSLSPYVDVSAVGKAGVIDFNASLYYEKTNSQFDSDGDRIRPDPNNQGGLADSDIWNGFLKLGTTFGGQRIEASVLYYDQLQDSEYNGFVNGNVAQGVKTRTLRGPLDPRSLKAGNENLLLNGVYAIEDVFGSSVRLQAYYQEFENIFSFAVPSTALPAGGSPLIYAEKHGGRVDVTTPVDFTGGGSVLWGVDYVSDSTGQDLVNLQLQEPFRRRINAPEVTQDSLAAFAQATLVLWDVLTLRGGGRYEDIKVSWDAFNIIENGTSTSPAPGIVIPAGDPDYSATTFNAGANYKLTEVWDLYAAYSEGYSVAEVGRLLRQASSANAVLRSNLQAQIVESYEAGVRAGWDRVQAQAAVFRTKSNLGTTLIPTSSPNNFIIARSPEETYGAEVTLDVQPVDALRLNFGLTWVEGKRDADNDGDVDRKLPSNRVPPVKLTAQAAYDWTAELSTQLQLVHSADRKPFDTITLLGEGPIDAYTLVNASASYDLGRYGTVNLGVSNLLNEDYFTLASQILRRNDGFSEGQGRTVRLSYAIRY